MVKLTIELIQEWTGEQDVYSLTKLDLSHRNLSDISPLVELTQLTWLYLDDNQIQDISPLTEFDSTNLVEIWIITKSRISLL